MKTNADDRRTAVYARFVLFASLVLPLSLVPTGLGAPPTDPLPRPNYSFDLESPSVIAGFVAAGDVLAYGFPHPIVVIPAINLGLSYPNDDLDALSASNTSMVPTDPIVVLFTVDRFSAGGLPPNPEFITGQVPYNVLDQAERGQVAGDQFMTTEKFNRSGAITRNIGRPPIDNNVLVRNNFDEGGTSFSAEPPSHARDHVGRALQDHVDATARLVFRDETPGTEVVNVYFSVTSASPSLSSLSGLDTPSGANIFYNPDPLGGAQTTLYATCYELGLPPENDIDAMIVFDFDGNGHFDNGDWVVFSLAPGSPYLGTIPGTGQPAAGAYLFVATAGPPPHTAPALYALPIELGLGAMSDNITALDFFSCANTYDCALVYGIRAVPFDWDDDGDADMVDFGAFTALMTGPGNCCPMGDSWIFDSDRDEDVDLVDFAAFQRGFTGP